MEFFQDGSYMSKLRQSDNQPDHLFYHCLRSKQFWIELELYWCLISNQRIGLCLEDVLFEILTENACPLLQVLNFFIILEKSICGTVGADKSFQIFMDLGRRKLLNMKQTKISNKDFFKGKWILTPYLS